MDDTRNEQLAVFSVLFTRSDEAAYARCCAPASWGAFQAAVPSRVASALPEPPLFDDYRHFMNRMLTPGMPGALPPVESLYKEWGGHAAGLQQGQGFYLGDAAKHVRAVCESLEIQIPSEYQAMPDHLVLLLELFEYLRTHAPAEDARDFAEHHFDWLGEYRSVMMLRAGAQGDPVLERVAEFYGQVLAAIDSFVFEGVQMQSALIHEGLSPCETRRSAEEVVLQ